MILLHSTEGKLFKNCIHKVYIMSVSQCVCVCVCVCACFADEFLQMLQVLVLRAAAYLYCQLHET